MTKEGKDRDARLRELGCIACYVQTGKLGTPASIHHVTDTGRRKGEAYTISLCDPGHHKNRQPGTDKEPFHHNKEVFEAEYGTQDELFDLCNDLLGYSAEDIARILGADAEAPRKQRKSKPKKKQERAVKKPVPFVPKKKQAPSVAKRKPITVAQKKKFKPSPEVVARQKQFQAEAKQRYLEKNGEALERQKEKRKELAVEMRKRIMQDRLKREEACCA